MVVNPCLMDNPLDKSSSSIKSGNTEDIAGSNIAPQIAIIKPATKIIHTSNVFINPQIEMRVIVSPHIKSLQTMIFFLLIRSQNTPPNGASITFTNVCDASSNPINVLDPVVCKIQ